MRIEPHFVFLFLCFRLFAEYLQTLFFLPFPRKVYFPGIFRSCVFVWWHHMVLGPEKSKGLQTPYFPCPSALLFLRGYIIPELVGKQRITANKEEFSDCETQKPHLIPHFHLSIPSLISQINFHQSPEISYRVPRHEPVERSQREWGNVVWENFYIGSGPPLGKKQWLIYLQPNPAPAAHLLRIISGSSLLRSVSPFLPPPLLLLAVLKLLDVSTYPR